MYKYGLFNVETKDFFEFDKYEDAYNGYLQILRDCIKESYAIPKDWYLVYIQDGNIVQFEQFTMSTHSVPAFPKMERDEFVPNW